MTLADLVHRFIHLEFIQKVIGDADGSRIGGDRGPSLLSLLAILSFPLVVVVVVIANVLQSSF